MMVVCKPSAGIDASMTGVLVVSHLLTYEHRCVGQLRSIIKTKYTCF